MALIDIKFTKFDNTPWGFRLVGGNDFPQPLMVTRVSEGSLAECMGLQTGDVIVRLNDQPISDLTHAEAHEAMLVAGNNFTLRVKRDGVPVPGQEEIDEENTASYMLPVEDILLGKGNPHEEIDPFRISPIEYTPMEFPPMDFQSMECPLSDYPTCDYSTNDYQSLASEDLQQDYEEVIEEVELIEEIPEKPRDENSEIVANKNLTDEEIAQLILEEEELLSDKGVLGVNFKKLRPRIPLLKESKVLQELQNEVIAEPPQIAEVKRVLCSTFLQKPERPVPMPKSKEPEHPEPEPETYKVVIKKQPKKGVTERLIAKGLLEPGSIRTPETRSEKNTPSATPEPHIVATPEPVQVDSRPESKAEVHVEEVPDEGCEDNNQEQKEQPEVRVEEPEDEEDGCSVRSEEPTGMSQKVEPLIKFDKKKIKALVTEEISLEKQLESVQNQLLALKQLPSEIEKHLRLVSEQLQKIAELSGARLNGQDLDSNEEEEEEERQRAEKEDKQSQEDEEDHRRQEEEQSDIEEGRGSAMSCREPPHIIEPSDDESNKEFEISVKSDEDDHRVKKYVVSYESKVLKEMADIQRDMSSSPAQSLGSYEPDPNLPPQEQLIQELQHRQGRKRSQDLWPQAKQLELTYGRRWRCPNDFFNDEMIAEVLSGQAEVIRGRALGVNFKKYEKTALPNYDHLMNSGVYKMIHKMEREPTKGIPARPPKVNAAEDIIERVSTPCMSMADDNSLRSVSH